MCASSELPASEYINLEWRATVNRPMLYLSRPRSNRLCQLYAYHACFWFLAAPRDFVCVRVHGRIQNLDLWGELSRAPRRKNKGAPGAESIWGWGVRRGEGVPLSIQEGVWRWGILYFFGSQNAYFSAFSSPSEYLLLHCNTFRSRPTSRLQYASAVWHSRLTVARSKALECLQKTALNIFFPGGEYATNSIIANVETLRVVDFGENGPSHQP